LFYLTSVHILKEPFSKLVTSLPQGEFILLRTPQLVRIQTLHQSNYSKTN